MTIHLATRSNQAMQGFNPIEGADLYSMLE
jgi:hypothetical protein